MPAQGSKHGIGRWISNEKDKDSAIIYAGSYENGAAEGHGNLSWPTQRPPKPAKADKASEQAGAEAEGGEDEHDLPNTTYVGEFKGGVRHGKGRFVQPVKVLVSQVAEGRDDTPAGGDEIVGETAERKAKKKEMMAALERKQKEKEAADKVCFDARARAHTHTQTHTHNLSLFSLSRARACTHTWVSLPTGCRGLGDIALALTHGDEPSEKGRRCESAVASFH